MAAHVTQSLDSLDLSWPHSVNYHADTARPDVSSPSPGREAECPYTSRQEPVTTYNGVPRELIRNAQPLLEDEIRVLDLNQGAHGMPLVGSLRKVRLSDGPAYEPLSYTWEDYDTVQRSDDNIEEDVRPALFILDTDSYLGLTSNCAKALCSVRKSGTDRTIWVDSICVNQDDAEERSHQVDLMKEIYAKAFTVLVYLGRESREDDISSNMAMSLLRQPDRLKKFDRLDQREATSLKRLFERHYFRRMWIVQEVALAKTLEFHCGPDISYVSKFAGKPLEAILGSRVTPPWLRHSKQTVRKTVRKLSWTSKASQAEHILDLVFDTALCDCKDDRDRIFALLSLLDTSSEERPRADYKLSTAQVYTGISAYLVMNGFWWGVLMLASNFALNSYPGLPSWVPDWSSLRNIAPQYSQDFKRIVRKLWKHQLDTVMEITSSGVISIRGMLLGSVTSSGYNSEPGFQHSDDWDGNKFMVSDLPTMIRDSGRSCRTSRYRSLWTLAKPIQDELLYSWQCGLEFMTCCNQQDNGDHIALILPDYSTVLILRTEESSQNPHKLVDIGMPTVRAVLPEDWKVDDDTWPEISLKFLQPMSGVRQAHLDVVLSPKEMFPRLSEYPELWGHNPCTSAMSLTYTAIQQVQRIDLKEIYLLEKWQKDAGVGVRILRDKNQLRLLIEEVDNLRHEDYRQIERESGLNQRWSFDDFLGLFIKDPFDREPMAWPNVQPHGDQPLDAMAILPQVMQWAVDTYRLLILLGNDGSTVDRWPKLLRDQMLCSEAMHVASFQVSVASVNAPSHASQCRDRTSLLLQKILRQLSDEYKPEPDQVQRPRSRNERYWDWRRFNSVMDQRFSILSYVLPDVEKIQAELHGLKPHFGAFAAYQVFAAHGCDPRTKDFTEVRLR